MHESEYMQTEYMMKHPKPTYEIEAKEKKTLKSLLTQEQIVEFEKGKIVALSEGHKLRLDDDVKGIVMVLAPLQGG